MKKAAFSVCIFVCLFMVLAGQASDQKLETQALINRTISGTCFSDEDMSGKQEDSEAGTEGVEVTLKRLIFPSAPLTATTDADGYYKFTDLPMGFFIIEAKVGDEDTKTTTNPVTLWLGFNGINKEINFGINKIITTTTSVQATTTSVPSATTSVPSATTSVPHTTSLPHITTTVRPTTTTTSINKEAINELVKSLGDPNQPKQEGTLDNPIPEGDPQSSPPPSGYASCAVQTYRAAPGYSELALLDNTSAVIWPGAIIKGESISPGNYTPVLVKRAPITIWTTFRAFEDVKAKVSATVNNPNGATVTQAVRDLMAQNIKGATEAKISFTKQFVYSEDELKLAIGAQYSYASIGSVKGSFHYNDSTIMSRMIIKYNQIYYSIDVVSQPPGDWFAEQVTKDQLTSQGIAPLYVSSISYGRMALFCIESTASESDLEAAVNVAVSYGPHTGEVDFDEKTKNVFKSSSISGFILGGSGSAGAKTTQGIDEMMNYITTGGNYGPDSPGSPLAYTFSKLKDSSPYTVVLNSEYKVRTCAPEYRIRLSCYDLWFTDGNEIYGQIQGRAYNNADGITLDPELGSIVLWDKGLHYYTDDPPHPIGTSVYFNFKGPSNTDLCTIVGATHLYDSDYPFDSNDFKYAENYVTLTEVVNSTGPVEMHTISWSGSDKCDVKFLIEYLP